MDTVNVAPIRKAVSQSLVRETLQEKMLYLNRLSHNEIAEYLFAYGVKGLCNSGSACPVARWLLSEIDWANRAYVSRLQVSVYPKGGVAEGPKLDGAISLEPFDNVRNFVFAFDAGIWPDLIDS